MIRVAAWVSLWFLFSVPFLVAAQTLPSIESPTTTARRYLENLIQSLTIQQDPLAPIPVQSTQAVDTLEMLLQRPAPVLPVSSDVSTTTQALIDSLLAQLAELQARITALQTGVSSAATTTVSIPHTPPLSLSCPIISRTLSRGMSGEDVAALQAFLIAAGHLAPENATGFFGELTQVAVQAWQAAQAIVSSGSPEETGFGVVGPRTRVALENCTA